MERSEITAILDTPDDLLEVNLLTDEEVEEILKKKGSIWATPATGINTSLGGSCCEGPQYAESCTNNFGDPESVCNTPEPTCL